MKYADKYKAVLVNTSFKKPYCLLVINYSTLPTTSFAVKDPSNNGGYKNSCIILNLNWHVQQGLNKKLIFRKHKHSINIANIRLIKLKKMQEHCKIRKRHFHLINSVFVKLVFSIRKFYWNQHRQTFAVYIPTYVIIICFIVNIKCLQITLTQVRYLA